MKRAVLLAAALVGAATGCRTPQAAIPLSQSDPRPRTLIANLRASAAERQGLRGFARVALDGRGGSIRSRQVLVVARPARLRVEILGLLNQTVAVLVTDGTDFDLFRVGDGERRTGPVYENLLWEVAGIALTPEEAVHLLLGAPPPARDLVLTAAAQLPDGGVRLELAGASGVVSEHYEFDPQGRLRRAVRRVGPGGIGWDAAFDGYADVEGGSFPHEISLRFPSLERRAEVRFRNVELNPELPPDAFVLHLPGGASTAHPDGEPEGRTRARSQGP